MRAVGTAHGSFCKQCRVFKGKPHPRARRYRSENGPRRARTAPSRPPWVALGQVNPHWGRLLTCPNDPFPAPIGHYLPQCGRASAHGRWRTGAQAHVPPIRNHRPDPPHPDSLPPGPRPRRGRHPSPFASGQPPIPSPPQRTPHPCPRQAGHVSSRPRPQRDPRPRTPFPDAPPAHRSTRASPDTCEPADDNDCITVAPKRFRRTRGCPYSGRTALLPGAPLTAPSAAGVPPRTGRSRGLQAERPRAQHSG